jgi:hypothetical protein
VQVIDQICNGHLLTQPDKCPDWIFEVMHGCWRSKVRERQHFSQIARLLNRSPHYHSFDAVMEKGMLNESSKTLPENDARGNQLKGGAKSADGPDYENHLKAGNLGRPKEKGECENGNKGGGWWLDGGRECPNIVVGEDGETMATITWDDMSQGDCSIVGSYSPSIKIKSGFARV